MSNLFLNVQVMTKILLNRNPRLLIPNPNLTFIRHNKIGDPKEVAGQILQKGTSDLLKEEAKLPQDSSETAKEIIRDFPEEPTTCCMSGCANCVWLDYAEKISAYYRDGGDKAMAEIEERVTDTNMKAFLKQELRMAAKTKQ